MLYTIGTSNRTAPEFIAELHRRGVTRLIDVRSSPSSRLPHFRGPVLARIAAASDIRYDWMGEVLGGRNDVPTTSPVYLKAADQLLTAAMREPTAIFCAEGDPAQCHRTWKVAAHLLLQHGLIARSILRSGADEDATATLDRTPHDSIPICLRKRVLSLLAACA